MRFPSLPHRVTHLAPFAFAVVAPLVLSARYVSAQEFTVSAPPAVVSRDDPRVPIASAVVTRILAGDGPALRRYIVEHAAPNYADSERMANDIKRFTLPAAVTGAAIREFRAGRARDVVVEIDVAGQMRGYVVMFGDGPDNRITGLAELSLG